MQLVTSVRAKVTWCVGGGAKRRFALPAGN